jgi:subtilisin family serine protease
VIVGIDWLVGHHQPGVPAVVNMSLGGAANPMLNAAVQAAVDDGITAAIAAGNDAADACSFSPAQVQSGLTVAASDIADLQALFSNRGPCVDLFAPGVDITSAWGTGDTTLNTISGTSMAAPHVAGAAAVLLSQLPTLSPAQVAQRLLADATPDVLGNVSPQTPNRLLFLDQYQTPPPQPPPPATVPPPPPTVRATVPEEVSSVSAAARVRSARVRWVLGGDGGAPLVEQKVRVYREGERVRTVTVGSERVRTRVKHLRPGVAYRFSVVAVNAVGSSPESEKSQSVRPRR